MTTKSTCRVLAVSGSKGGDYQQYMKQYSGDYQKYMQGAGGSGSKGGGLSAVHEAVLR